jgi:hypothetical protein
MDSVWEIKMTQYYVSLDGLIVSPTGLDSVDEAKVFIRNHHLTAGGTEDIDEKQYQILQPNLETQIYNLPSTDGFFGKMTIMKIVEVVNSVKRMDVALQ